MPKLHDHFPSLYNIALRSLVEWRNFDILSFDNLPGFAKEDLLKAALIRGKCKENISEFLHPNVKKLSINGCKITCKELENISQCTQLRILEMNALKYHRFSHSNSALESLLYNLNSLVKLHIQRNDGVTDSVATVLAQKCPLLQELDVSGCFNLGDNGVQELGKLSNLKAVNLSDTYISDVALAALSCGYCSRSLTELKLNNCIHISDEGINNLLHGCNKLFILLFSGCPKVSVDIQLALESFLSRDKKSKTISWTVYF